MVVWAAAQAALFGARNANGLVLQVGCESTADMTSREGNRKGHEGREHDVSDEVQHVKAREPGESPGTCIPTILWHNCAVQ